ncbi:hypothetical protein EYF80_034807 [Liparis tanakae]|uniref:Uncharacterized protein n=1 Tax=Liparis tanakae TaxID=230148 RepID=A0A4Z2GP70_9TELE|nr:hypothetical protein EYF80_034807 [Liparis tanakae]
MSPREGLTPSSFLNRASGKELRGTGSKDRIPERVCFHTLTWSSMVEGGRADHQSPEEDVSGQFGDGAGDRLSERRARSTACVPLDRAQELIEEQVDPQALHPHQLLVKGRKQLQHSGLDLLARRATDKFKPEYFDEVWKCLSFLKDTKKSLQAQWCMWPETNIGTIEMS